MCNIYRGTTRIGLSQLYRQWKSKSNSSNLSKLTWMSQQYRQSSELKDVVAKKIPAAIATIKDFRKKHGAFKVSDVTVNQVYGGMRGIKCMVCETSTLDPNEGIRFRGHSIPELRKSLPKADGGEEPLPEGIFWLLMTGDIPTKEQVNGLSKELGSRANLPSHVDTMLRNFPRDLHPMSQLSCAITALNNKSKFSKAILEGIPKAKYWETAFDDTIDLLANLPIVVATIYQIAMKGSDKIPSFQPNLDWSSNLCNMMGYGDKKEFVDLIRLYLTLHSDHEGGNVSAHTVHLVSSALSDPYLSLAAGMNGLAGPLHGLANQQVLLFIEKLIKEVGKDPSDEKIGEYVQAVLKSGRVIPGYGHAVLRKIDPRYISQREFAEKRFPNDPIFKVVQQLFKIVPPILTKTGKVQNPWPNVDANSGVLLQHYGLTEMKFYTVLFGMSRALGTLAQLIWARAVGLPIERPKSFSTEEYKKMAEQAIKT